MNFADLQTFVALKPRISAQDADCRRWAGADAGAAAGTQRVVDSRQRAVAQARRKMDGAHIAEIAADPAFDAAFRQAGVADGCLVRPRRQSPGADQRQRLACGRTIAAESTFVLAEIDGGKTAVPGDQNFLRTGAQAIAAASTAVNEIRFRQGPRRPDFRLGAGATAQEAAAAGVDHRGRLFCLFHLVDAAAQHLVDFRTGFDLGQQGFPVGDAFLVVAGFHGGGAGEEQ